MNIMFVSRTENLFCFVAIKEREYFWGLWKGQIFVVHYFLVLLVVYHKLKLSVRVVVLEVLLVTRS